MKGVDYVAVCKACDCSQTFVSWDEMETAGWTDISHTGILVRPTEREYRAICPQCGDKHDDETDEVNDERDSSDNSRPHPLEVRQMGGQL